MIRDLEISKESALAQMNRHGSRAEPFVFLINADAERAIIFPGFKPDAELLLYHIEDFKNYTDKSYQPSKAVELVKRPIPYPDYKKAFEKVQQHLRNGDSYLLNLTFPTQVNLNYTPEEIFYLSGAKYKLLLKNEFVVFSPETFVKIGNGRIFSCPMKGTIDAAIPDAREIIMNDAKEKAEHYTIVDLIRNDLSLVSDNVKVTRFRYIDEIQTNGRNLLQVSSEIEGDLPAGYERRLGDVIFSLLPAGSVTGAPKKRTVEIIHAAENYQRGYYTGIGGIYTGESLISFVLIRFIETTRDGWFYKSGGGITVNSDCMKEYQEMIDKVYVPFV